MRAGFMALLLISGLVVAMTPDDFNSRMGNYELLNMNAVVGTVTPPPGVTLYPGYTGLAPTPNARYLQWNSLIEKTKSDYLEAYNAKEAGDMQRAETYYQLVMQDFEKLKEYTEARIDLVPLVNVIKVEFGKPTPTIGNIITAPNTIKNPAPSATTIVHIKAAVPSKKIIPTVSPDQMRGKKTIWGALWDVLYDNGLIIGVFLVGILVIYGLYHKDEEESSFG
ncbi:MAG: hypothetical protein ABIG96_00230 [Candidatus Micrarchaeota archaeon]